MIKKRFLSLVLLISIITCSGASIAYGAEGSAEFTLFAQKATAKLSASVSKTSTISSSISVTLPVPLKTNSFPTVSIYAWGIQTGGAMKYAWSDVSGGSGYTTKSVAAMLPYTNYNGTFITFGAPIY